MRAQWNGSRRDESNLMGGKTDECSKCLVWQRPFSLTMTHNSCWKFQSSMNTQTNLQKESSTKPEEPTDDLRSFCTILRTNSFCCDPSLLLCQLLLLFNQIIAICFCYGPSASSSDMVHVLLFLISALFFPVCRIIVLIQFSSFSWYNIKNYLIGKKASRIWSRT